MTWVESSVATVCVVVMVVSRVVRCLRECERRDECATENDSYCFHPIFPPLIFHLLLLDFADYADFRRLPKHQFLICEICGQPFQCKRAV